MTRITDLGIHAINIPLKDPFEISLGVQYNCQIRIDVNQGFSPKEAVRFAKTLETHNIEIEIFEQPVLRNDIAEMKFVRDNIQCSVFADESVFTPNGAIKIGEMKAADGINIKLMKSAVFETLDIVAIAQSLSLDLMIGCMGESCIGISFSAQIASNFSIFHYIDLDSLFFYKRNLIKFKRSPFLSFKGHGIGIDYDKIRN